MMVSPNMLTNAAELHDLILLKINLSPKQVFPADQKDAMRLVSGAVAGKIFHKCNRFVGDAALMPAAHDRQGATITATYE